MNKLLDVIRDEARRQRFLEDNKDMLIKVAAAVILVVAAFFVFVSDGEKQQEDVQTEEAVMVEEEADAAHIYVDIGGEVQDPMVVELEEGSRVQDAIEAAGGITENADLTEINRAAFVEDGEKILIPSVPELTEEDILYADDGTGVDTVQLYSDDRININTADSEELQQLNGVGPATAEKILQYREENGRFRDIEEIKEVSGIGEKTFEKFREDIKV